MMSLALSSVCEELSLAEHRSRTRGHCVRSRRALGGLSERASVAQSSPPPLLFIAGEKDASCPRCSTHELPRYRKSPSFPESGVSGTVTLLGPAGKGWEDVPIRTRMGDARGILARRPPTAEDDFESRRTPR